MSERREEEYDFYEDENKELGVLPFLIREKRLIGFLAMFLLCLMTFNCIGRQMDQMAEDSRPIGKGAPAKSNPWSKD